MTKSNYAKYPTLKVSQKWLLASSNTRNDLIDKLLLDDRFSCITLVESKDDGQVIVKFNIPLEAHLRGTLLLDFEEKLKELVDVGLTVWLEPLGDKNSLRNLRGIKVKK